jgi:hypothetical protein
MSKPGDYPLFNHWILTLDWLMDLAERMPKHLRFSLSQRLLEHSLDVAELIVSVIYSKSRKPLLAEINRRLELLRILLRICYRRKLISARQYEYISMEIDKAGKMCGGWAR